MFLFVQRFACLGVVNTTTHRSEIKLENVGLRGKSNEIEVVGKIKHFTDLRISSKSLTK